MPHDEGLPIPEPPDTLLLKLDDEEMDGTSNICVPSTSKDPYFDHGFMSSEPHIITQHELNDLYDPSFRFPLLFQAGTRVSI